MGDPLVNTVNLLEFHGSRTGALLSHGDMGVHWASTRSINPWECYVTLMEFPTVSDGTPMGRSVGHSVA